MNVRLQAVDWLAEQADRSPSTVAAWSSALAVEPGLQKLPAELLAEDLQQQDLYRAFKKLPALATALQVDVVRAARTAPVTVRPLAIPVLGIIENPSPETLSALLFLLRDSDDVVRSSAGDAIRVLGPRYAEAADVTTPLLQNPDLKRSVLTLLANGWPARLTDERALSTFLTDSDSEVAVLAIRALQHRPRGIPPAAELEPLVKRIADRQVQTIAVCGLGPFVSTDAQIDAIAEGCLRQGAAADIEAALTAVAHIARASGKQRAAIRTVLTRSEPAVREAALRALAPLADETFLIDYQNALVDRDAGVVGAALEALSLLGVKAAGSKPAVLAIVRNSPNQGAARPYGKVLQAIAPADQSLLDDLVGLLTTPETEVQATTLALILAEPRLRARMINRCDELLRSDDDSAREAAVAIADGITLPTAEMEAVVATLTQPEPPLEALALLADHGAEARPYAPVIARFLDEEDTSMVGHAIRTLTRINAASDYETALVRYADSNDDFVRGEAIKALGPVAARHETIFRNALAARKTAPDAIRALMETPATSRRYDVEIAAYLRGEDYQAEALVARDAIGRMTPLETPAVLSILELAHVDPAHIDRYRFFAFLASGGQADTLDAIAWLGSRPPDPDALSERQQRLALLALYRLWPSTTNAPRVRYALGTQLGRIVEAGSFTSDDIYLLGAIRSELETAKHPAADQVSRVLLRLRIYAYVGYGFMLLAGHLVAWFLLLVIYPRSKFVQAWFFWNPWIRKYAGFGYVGLVASRVPFVRNRLLAPFRDRFHEDAFAPRDGADEVSYFRGSQVESVDPNAASPPRRGALVEELPRIRGRVALEGESGLGKSMYLRQLVRASRNATIYLQAERCGRGVVEAIQQKLRGFATDKNFLETIIYTGGIDLCIDGLNEVSPDTRAEITEFVRGHPHANVLLATQPLVDWHAPGRTYRLLPLDRGQILEFFESRYPQSAVPREMSLADYQQACRTYVASALAPDQDAGLLASVALVLSNPMDATVVAQMLLARKQPDLLGLQEQQFQLAAQSYRRATQQQFPLAPFSEKIYQMRLLGQSELPDDIPEPALTALAAHKLVFHREGRDGVRRYYFRHDKILEFFVLQAFLADDERPQQHLDDPRFRGVYFLMAMQMPFEAATMLRDQLVLRAAQTNDHTVSDRFVQLLQSRRLATTGIPRWLDRYHLPDETTAREKLRETERAGEAALRHVEEAREVVDGWFSCRSILMEAREDRLLQSSATIMQRMGAVSRPYDGATACHVVTPGGGQFTLLTSVAGDLISSDDIADAERIAASLAQHASAPATAIVLVMNVQPAVDPANRTSWLTPAAERSARERRVTCVPTLALVESLQLLQRSRCTLEQFWQSLETATGVWQGFEHSSPGGDA